MLRQGLERVGITAKAHGNKSFHFTRRKYMLNRLSIKWRMLLIVIGILFLFLAMLFFTPNLASKNKELGPNQTSKVMLQDQKAKISVASHAVALALGNAIQEQGITDPEHIVKLIRAMVNSTLYEEDKSGYFFVYQGTTNVAFPVKQENQGKDLGALKDKNGVFVIRELESRAKNGGGYVEYIWPKPGAGDTPKLSYAEMIPGLDMWVGTGVYIDNIEHTKEIISKEMDTLSSKKVIQMLITAGTIFLGILLLSLFISFGISRGLNNLIINLRDVVEGDGDLTKRIDIRSQDELSQLGQLFNTFLANLQSIIRRIAENANDVNTSADVLNELSTVMNERSVETSSSSESVAAGAEEMATNLNAVAAAMEESSTNTAIVATAAEEMTATIGEIAANADKANKITSEAVNQAASASEKMSQLGVAASAIGKVTETITEISDQTNLLALNATIEAARAGESGKGFAVVANEIKVLAKQTAEATQHIKEQIEGMQTTTGVTIDEIARISKVIGQVSELVSSIATAVGEQSSATSEIASNISQASQGLQEVTENVGQSSGVADEITREITKVSTTASEIAKSSDQLQDRANHLQTMASELRQIVAKFRT